LPAEKRRMERQRFLMEKASTDPLNECRLLFPSTMPK
jgi:hypothetical protein